MPQAPVAELTAQSFEPPRNTQFSVFLAQRVGKLLEVLDLFEGRGVTLAGMSIVDATDHAVIRLLTSNAELTRRILARNDLPYSEAPVVAVEVEDWGSFGKACRALLRAELSIHYAYPLLVRPRGLPVLVLYTDDPILTAQVLRRSMFTLLAENDLGDNRSHNVPGDPTDLGRDSPRGGDDDDGPEGLGPLGGLDDLDLDEDGAGPAVTN